jgi:hypothetical protein
MTPQPLRGSRGCCELREHRPVHSPDRPRSRSSLPFPFVLGQPSYDRRQPPREVRKVHQTGAIQGRSSARHMHTSSARVQSLFHTLAHHHTSCCTRSAPPHHARHFCVRATLRKAPSDRSLLISALLISSCFAADCLCPVANAGADATYHDPPFCATAAVRKATHHDPPFCARAARRKATSDRNLSTSALLISSCLAADSLCPVAHSTAAATSVFTHHDPPFCASAALRKATSDRSRSTSAWLISSSLAADSRPP